MRERERERDCVCAHVRTCVYMRVRLALPIKTATMFNPRFVHLCACVYMCVRVCVRRACVPSLSNLHARARALCVSMRKILGIHILTCF